MFLQYLPFNALFRTGRLLTNDDCFFCFGRLRAWGSRILVGAEICSVFGLRG